MIIFFWSDQKRQIRNAIERKCLNYFWLWYSLTHVTILLRCIPWFVLLCSTQKFTTDCKLISNYFQNGCPKNLGYFSSAIVLLFKINIVRWSSPCKLRLIKMNLKIRMPTKWRFAFLKFCFWNLKFKLLSYTNLF